MADRDKSDHLSFYYQTLQEMSEIFTKKLSLMCNFAFQYLGWLAIPYNLEKATFD